MENPGRERVGERGTLTESLNNWAQSLSQNGYAPTNRPSATVSETRMETFPPPLWEWGTHGNRSQNPLNGRGGPFGKPFLIKSHEKLGAELGPTWLRPNTSKHFPKTRMAMRLISPLLSLLRIGSVRGSFAVACTSSALWCFRRATHCTSELRQLSSRRNVNDLKDPLMTTLPLR